MSTEGPQWLPVPGYEGHYEVSDAGAVRSLKRRTPRLLKPIPHGDGYFAVSLSLDGQETQRLIHHLVMLAFTGPCPPGLEVRHMDGDGGNNARPNLIYGTRSENNLDAVEHGTHHWAAKTHCPAGHPYDDANTYRVPSDPGRRHCRACQRRRSLAYYHRKRKDA